MPWLRRLILAALSSTLWAWGGTAVAAEDEVQAQVEVTTVPYVDMRTGPGRGYPVLTIAQRGEPMLFLKRRNDWYKVRNYRNEEGWVWRGDVIRVLEDPRITEQMRVAILGPDDRNRFEAGFAGGQLDGDPVIAVRGGYWLTDYIFAELQASQGSGTYASTHLYSVGLQISPLGEYKYAPYFGLAYGRFENDDRASLVGGGTQETVDTVTADAAIAAIGVRWRLSTRFVLRADYRHVLSLTDQERVDDFNEITGGFSFAF